MRAALLLLVFHIISSHPTKNTARPVHEVFEVINEQARIDDKRIQTGPGLLPYGNPLAGNSQYNAKLHAENQQAMFNAERVRQHRAQLQRLNKGPTQTDSYMRAYHESQENHHLALEQQQSNLRETKPSSTVIKTSTPRTRSSVTNTPKTRSSTRQRQNLKRTRSDLVKLMQGEVISKDKSRNHRSYGSVEYEQYVQPQKYKTIYVTAGPTYDQGVTIKPNGNVGVASSEEQEEPTRLFTQAVPSPTQYVYPKQYRQMQQYESAHDIASLNALLGKQPEDQLNEFNALIHSDTQSNKELDTPIDLYFYAKDPSHRYVNSIDTQVPKDSAYRYGDSINEQAPQDQTHSHPNTLYAQVAQNYAYAYAPQVKDHTPITEEVDDVEDPNNVPRKPFTSYPIYVAPTAQENSTTNNINYYSVQPIVANKPIYYPVKEHKPSYQALKYEKPLTFYNQDIQNENSSTIYLHHNVKHAGVQHLNEDGSGVSAYGEDNLQYAANYEFGYHVSDHESGNDFGHHEAKKDGNTDGHYHVLLPDGRKQTVKYHAGPSGFHADITYDVQK